MIGKFILSFAICLWVNLIACAQPATEVYVFDLGKENDAYSISNPINVSDNPGYDNQPYFLPDGSGLLYASTREGQTDIARYNLSDGTKSWLTDTPGGEYSPQLIPGTQKVSAVRLDPDGTQLLYAYPLTGGEGEILVPELVIGYYAWLSPKRYVAFVLGDPPTLQTGKAYSRKSKVFDSDIGRSIHSLSAKNHFSYVKRKEDGKRILYIDDIKQKGSNSLLEPLEGSQDMVWLSENTVLMGQGSKLFLCAVKGDKTWKEWADLREHGLENITRLAVNQQGTKLAIVADEKK